MRVLFIYWGRRGLNQFVAELADAAARTSGLEWHLSLSRQNEEYDRFCSLGDRLIPVETFSKPAGALYRLPRVLTLRRQMAKLTLAHKFDCVINIMPHVWSPYIASIFRESGCRYVSILHDAEQHAGDLSGWVNPIKFADMRLADVVVTLSRTVSDHAIKRGLVDASRIRTLFHSRLTFQPYAPPLAYSGAEPLRILLIGRLLKYKGIDILLDALEMLAFDKLPISLSIAGEGNLAPYNRKLRELGVDVDNRWLANTDFAQAFSRHHAVVLPYLAASQSGVAAAALGAGVPVIALPVGGIVEQVQDRVTGIIANGKDAGSLARAIAELASAPELHSQLLRGIEATAADYSMDIFLRCLLQGEVAPVRPDTRWLGHGSDELAR